MKSKNYGLAGGMLDGGKHIDAAIDRLCTPDEVGSYRDRTSSVAPLDPEEWADGNEDDDK